MSKLDEKTLMQIASAGNGMYIHAGNDEFGLNPIIDDIRKMETESFSSVVFEEYDEQYMYLFGLAILFFVLEGVVSERKNKRRLFE